MTTFFKTISNTIKHWYMPLIIGLLLIAMGIYIFTVPLATYLTLTAFFTASFIASGILEIYFSVANRNEIDGWGWYLTGGILTLFVGILLAVEPGISATTLPFFVGFSLLFKSFQGLGLAFDLKNYGILRWGNLALTSVLGIIFSLLLVMNPIFTGISLVTLTAFAFIFAGISGIVLAFDLKKLKNLPAQISSDLNNKMEKLKEEYKAKYKAANLTFTKNGQKNENKIHV
jgi:uncharacterized membrane protein HdeD (DUF308 family)